MIGLSSSLLTSLSVLRPNTTLKTVTATSTAGNFSLGLPSFSEGVESGWISADVIGGKMSTNSEVANAVRLIAGEVSVAQDRFAMFASESCPRFDSDSYGSRQT